MRVGVAAAKELSVYLRTQPQVWEAHGLPRVPPPQAPLASGAGLTQIRKSAFVDRTLRILNLGVNLVGSP
jgi:hypothetical protein